MGLGQSRPLFGAPEVLDRIFELADFEIGESEIVVALRLALLELHRLLEVCDALGYAPHFAQTVAAVEQLPRAREWRRTVSPTMASASYEGGGNTSGRNVPGGTWTAKASRRGRSLRAPFRSRAA